MTSNAPSRLARTKTTLTSDYLRAVQFLQEIGHWNENKDKPVLELLAIAQKLKDYYI